MGEANTTDHAKFTSPPKPGETKEITSIPPRHKEYVFTLQIQASELSSLSQELVSTSVPLKTIPMVSFTEGGFIFVGSQLKPQCRMTLCQDHGHSHSIILFNLINNQCCKLGRKRNRVRFIRGKSKCLNRSWRIETVSGVLALQVWGPRFDPQYKKPGLWHMFAIPAQRRGRQIPGGWQGSLT